MLSYRAGSGSQKNARHLVRYQPIRALENGQGRQFMAVRPAISHYVKKALVGTNIIRIESVNSFQNSQCKYSDSIGQEPCHAKSRKRVCAKGIVE